MSLRRSKVSDLQVHRVSSAGRGAEIFEVLEAPNWAPWLRFTAEELDAQAAVFPEGQILLCDEDQRPVASLSANRVYWDGDAAHLPTWDEVAGPTHTYRETYDPRGNAIVLLSGNVRASARGARLTDLWIDEVRRLARETGVRQVIGPFRPSEYGQHKLSHPGIDFTTYCRATRLDGTPVDAWLRSVARKRVQWLAVSPRAMVVQVPGADLESYRAAYLPQHWSRVTDDEIIASRLMEHHPGLSLRHVDEVWECGETGTWYFDESNDRALYVESNLWGRVSL